MEDDQSEFKDAPKASISHTMIANDEQDVFSVNLDLEFQKARSTSVMPLEILYKCVRDSYKDESGKRVDRIELLRERPVSAPALMFSTPQIYETGSSLSRREDSKYSFIDNITEAIESMLDHTLTTDSAIPKGLSGKPLQVEVALNAFTRGEYSTDTVQEDYLPNKLRIPLKAITEEKEETSPTQQIEQATIVDDNNVFIAELEDTSRAINRNSGDSSQSSDPMGMFNYDYLKPSDWYDSQPPMIRSRENVGAVSMASSPPISPARVPIIHPLISPFPPPDKPLPALPSITPFPGKQRGGAADPTTTLSRTTPPHLLQTKLYHEILGIGSEDSEILLSDSFYTPNHTRLHSDGVCPYPVSGEDEKEIPEAHIHPLFRKVAQIPPENSTSLSPIKRKPLPSAVWSGFKHHRGLSDASDRPMLSPSLPHSNPPSSYLHSPQSSPRVPSTAESDPFTSPMNELSPSPLRLSSASADSALQAGINPKKDASTERHFSLGNRASLKSRTSLERSASFTKRPSLKGRASTDKGGSFTERMSLDKSVCLDKPAFSEEHISLEKRISPNAPPFLEKRASLAKRASMDNYGSFAERASLYQRPSLEKHASLDSITPLAGLRRSFSMKTSGIDAPYILRDFLPQKRLSIDCIKEYAQAMDDIHGLERLKPLDAVNEDTIDIPKEQFRILPTGLNSPSLTQLSLKSGADNPWPMKKKSSHLRRLSEAPLPLRVERESFSTLSSGASRSDTVTRSASLTVPTITEQDSLDGDDLSMERPRSEASLLKRSGRMQKLLALRVEEDKQTAAMREQKERADAKGKMAKLMRKAQSFEKMGEGFKKFFSGAKKDEWKGPEAGC